MSRPAAGRYVIYNRVLSPTGQKLAISYRNDGPGATVTALSGTPAPYQIWDVRDFDSRTQSINQDSSNLQCGWGDGFVSLLPPGNYVWVIRSSDTGYTIQDGGESNNWGIQGNPVDPHLVNINLPDGSDQQRWIFEKI